MAFVSAESELLLFDYVGFSEFILGFKNHAERIINNVLLCDAVK